MLRWWGRLRGRPRILLVGGVGAGLALGLAVTAFALIGGEETTRASIPPTATSTATNSPTRTPTSTPTATPTPVLHTAPFDGVLMTEEEWAARKDLPALLVMLDNHPDAYPQTGLDKADLVYEAFVEGRMTRYMAVFWRNDVGYIEPVRSVRTPFLIWTIELDGYVAHVGYSGYGTVANAQLQIQQWGIRSLDQFRFGTAAYYRNGNRYAPHNVVTSTDSLRQIAATLGPLAGPVVEPWLYKEDGKGLEAAPPAASVEVNFRDQRLPNEVIRWQWDAASASYLRFKAGSPHVDGGTGQQLRFKNVVVMRVPWYVADDRGHVNLDQVGTGSAQVFIDGKRVDATWKKDDARGRTRYYDSTGAEIAFNRGSTFVEVVGVESLVQTFDTAASLPVP